MRSSKESKKPTTGSSGSGSGTEGPTKAHPPAHDPHANSGNSGYSGPVTTHVIIQEGPKTIPLKSNLKKTSQEDKKSDSKAVVNSTHHHGHHHPEHHSQPKDDKAPVTATGETTDEGREPSTETEDERAISILDKKLKKGQQAILAAKAATTHLKSKDVDEFWYSRRVMRSFFPLYLLMLVTLRFPFHVSRTQDEDQKDEKAETDHDPTQRGWKFSYNWKNPLSILFLITSVVVFLLIILYFINWCGAQINFPRIEGNVSDYFEGEHCLPITVTGLFNNNSFPLPGPGTVLTTEILRAEEMFYLTRNTIPFSVILVGMVNMSAGSYWIYRRRRFICFYLNFIVVASEKLRVNFAHGLIRFMWIFIVVYVVSVLLIVLCFFLNFAPMTGGLKTMLVTMTYRVFDRQIHAISTTRLTQLKHAHFIIFVFVMFGSRVFIFLFMWCCFLIQNGFLVWNYRLDQLLLRNERTKPYNQRKVNRTFPQQLFTDHVMLLDLIDGVNRIFSGIAETYYLTEAVSICLQAYFVFHSQTGSSDFQGERQSDGIVMFLFLAQSIFVIYTVSYAAADINDEALEGLEILRRKGFMGRKSDEELHFMMSMYVSFTGHFDISVVCANFVNMDRTFILMLANTITMFITMIVQLDPHLQLTNNVKLSLLKDHGRLISKATVASSFVTGSPILVQTDGVSTFGRDPCK